MPSRAAVQHPGASPPPLAYRAPRPGIGVMLEKALLLSACFALAVTYPALLQGECTSGGLLEKRAKVHSPRAHARTQRDRD